MTAGENPPAAKAIYQDAWWVSKLDLLRGVRENLTTEPPVAIHYHDGEVGDSSSSWFGEECLLLLSISHCSRKPCERLPTFGSAGPKPHIPPPRRLNLERTAGLVLIDGFSIALLSPCRLQRALSEDTRWRQQTGLIVQLTFIKKPV